MGLVTKLKRENHLKSLEASWAIIQRNLKRNKMASEEQTQVANPSSDVSDEEKKQVEKNRKKKPRAKGLQLSANFNKDLTKKINASIQSDLASTCHKVEEGKSFKIIGSELGDYSKKPKKK